MSERRPLAQFGAWRKCSAYLHPEGEILMQSNRLGRALFTMVIAAAFSPVSLAKDETTGGKMSTSKTQDIINTLRERGAFHKMLDGLDTAFDLDNTLKGKGPFTVFAAEDKAWAKINQADQDTLFANKKKLAQVLSYEIVKGEELDCKALSAMSSVKSMEGEEIPLSTKKEGKNKEQLFADQSKVKTADIKCTNGIIHIVDAPLMPKLKQ
jgi:uncharacterized surface protein with fasciclin (FAS1) repeats